MVQCCPLSTSDDAERPKVYKQTRRTSAKDHTCTECYETIPRGTQYEKVTGIWWDSWDTYKTCMSCVEIRDHFSCEGWVFGQLWEDLENNFFPDMKAGGPCMEGLSPEAKARLFEERMKWYEENGHDD